MQELPRPDEIDLVTAAWRLRRNYQAVRSLVIRGELEGRRIGVRWFVSLASVERLEMQDPSSMAQPA